MQILNRWVSLALVLACAAGVQQAGAASKAGQEKPSEQAAQVQLKALLEANVNAEWAAFKNKDKKAYDDLLADDFSAVEDDNQGMRTKAAAVAEIDRSVVGDFKLFAITVIPLDANSALVTYELTLLFPPKAVVRFKRVMVSEVWIKRSGQWKERYYQETHVR